MKIKTIILSCLLSAIVLAVCFEYSWAGSEADIAGLKIGVVSVQNILQNCKRSAKYREEAVAEQDRFIAESDKLRAEMEADKAGLKTLKIGSSDYMARVKEIFEKRAGLQAAQEFRKQEITLKDQQWIEGLYKAILQETGEVAKLKGLDLVFEKSEPEFPAQSANELMRTIDTNKLLYSGGCLDITDEVMARVDEEK